MTRRGRRLGGAQKPLVVGDGLFTDILGANRAGLDVLFIADGVHGEETEPYTAEHLGGLVRQGRRQRAWRPARQLTW